MEGLPYLIAKSDWGAVWRTLNSSPEQVSIPVPTNTQEIVYPLHQAVCNTTKPVTENILDLMIRVFPKALDLNVFLGACQNPRLSSRSLEFLLDSASPEVSRMLRTNVKRYASIAVKRKNIEIVGLFIDRHPEILHSSDILILACTCGTGKMVELIIKAGHENNVDRGGGIFIKNKDKEDALDVAMRLFDEKDRETYSILAICLQYANAARKGKKEPVPYYPILMAAIDWCPPVVFQKVMKLNMHEMVNTDKIGKLAILKAIRLASEESFHSELPDIFSNQILLDACTTGRSEVVKKFLENQDDTASHCKEKPQGRTKRKNVENALEIAIRLYDANNNARCEVLKNCVQYANASKMGLRFQVSEAYPTLLAASGLVPYPILVSIGKKYKKETKIKNHAAKFALEKVLRLSQEYGLFPKRLDRRLQFPRNIKTTRTASSRSTLDSIPE